ncbi:bacteriohemerythrin [Dongia deserti]|uniref:bacteriohemerythrin n=1 Tax=Dongia deserti TaxID=2268030 RepID=UPI000E6540F2|nr:hemerythrin family protein [Dongia deserti]
MFAEVIRGRFREDKTTDAAPYALPVSAEIGLPVLDQAHTALLARLNAAHRALVSGDEPRARLQLDMLRSDLAVHFDIEEQIMQALGFADLRHHIRYHAASTAQFDEICRVSLSRGSLTVGDLDLCFQSLIDEMLRGDIDLKSHFQSMGSRPATSRRGA